LDFKFGGVPRIVFGKDERTLLEQFCYFGNILKYILNNTAAVSGAAGKYRFLVKQQ